MSIKPYIIRTKCGEKVEIYRRSIVKGERNSTKTAIEKINEGELVSIQSISGLQSVGGFVLIDKSSGTQINASFKMYCDIIDLKDKDIIKRIERDGLFYEVRNLETNGTGASLSHMKSYLVKADNQNVL